MMASARLALGRCGAAGRLPLAVLALTAGGAAASGAEPFTYRAGDDGPVFEVTSNGLSAIVLAGRSLATGAWFASDASWLLDSSIPPAPASAGVMQVEILAPDNVRARHTAASLCATFDYRFAGEDVTIRARVENSGASNVLATAFGGLVFTFGEDPVEGYPRAFADGELRSLAPRRRGFHPSWETPFGGSYRTDGTAGVGLSPLETGLAQSLFWWSREDLPRGHGRLRYLRRDPIPAGGARTFSMAMRVSRHTDWRHLLAPYKAHFGRTFGPVRYRADYRPIAQYVAASGGRSAPGSGNPYGWQWLPFRFDQAQGMTNFAEHVVSAVTRAHGQGVIVWALTGWSERGCNYRPDFDVLPPEVTNNLSRLIGPLRSAGVRLGSLARPGEIVTPVAWGRDATVRVHAGAESQVALVLRRFRNLTDQGLSMFYLDTFGSDVEDSRLMPRYREALGPEVLTFSEFWTDILMVYSGGYGELLWDGDRQQYREFWRRLRLWEMVEWLIPGAQLIGHDRRLHGVELPPGTTPSLRFLFERHITPLLALGTRSTGPKAEELRLLVEEFLDEQGRWKK